MRAKRRWAALAVTAGLLAGSVGGGIALGARSSGSAMKSRHAMKHGAAMKQQGAAMHGAAMSGAHMTG